jgi:hypothetical protein
MLLDPDDVCWRRLGRRNSDVGRRSSVRHGSHTLTGDQHWAAPEQQEPERYHGTCTCAGASHDGDGNSGVSRPASRWAAACGW